MSKRGVRFVERWVSEWVHPITYWDEDGLEARQYAVQCLAAAEAEGISKKEIEEDLGNIVGYMAGANNSQMDEEVARLAAKDG
jgi:hypothetical protein